MTSYNHRHFLKQKIKEKLGHSENCDKWFNEFGPFKKETIDSVYKTCDGGFRDFNQRKAENNNWDLRYSAIETIAKRCIQTKILIEKSNIKKALEFSAEILNFIEECIEKRYFSHSYKNGFNYVVQCLVVAIDLQIVNTTVEELGRDLLKLDGNENFSTFDHAARLALKLYFVSNFQRDAHDLQIPVISKLILADPNNLEWRFRLYTVHRLRRINTNKFEKNNNNRPSNEEKRAIVTAYSLPNAQFDPRICLGYSFCLAEEISYSAKQNLNTFTFGKTTFNSLNEAVSTISVEVNKILAIDPTSVTSNIDVAKIYSSILPQKYQKTGFAKICIDRAILFHPNSSKANHRMAVFLLKEKQFNESLTYFEKAFQTDERNYYAAMDLLKFYLHDAVKYQLEIQNLFDKLIDHPNYKDNMRQIGTFLFYKALFNFFRGASGTGLRILVDSYKQNSRAIDEFKELGTDKNRFNWKSDFLEKNFRALLTSRLNDNVHSPDKQILTKILKGFDSFRPYQRRQEDENRTTKKSVRSGTRSRSQTKPNYETFSNSQRNRSSSRQSTNNNDQRKRNTQSSSTSAGSQTKSNYEPFSSSQRNRSSSRQSTNNNDQQKRNSQSGGTNTGPRMGAEDFFRYSFGNDNSSRFPNFNQQRNQQSYTGTFDESQRTRDFFNRFEQNYQSQSSRTNTGSRTGGTEDYSRFTNQQQYNYYNHSSNTPKKRHWVFRLLGYCFRGIYRVFLWCFNLRKNDSPSSGTSHGGARAEAGEGRSNNNFGGSSNSSSYQQYNQKSTGSTAGGTRTGAEGGRSNNNFGNSSQNEGYGDFFNRSSNQQSTGSKTGYSSSNNKNQYNENREKKTFTPQDNWSILGVSKTATKEEIRKAYRKLCLENHPDKNMHLAVKERETKLEKMKFINNAYHAVLAFV